MKLILNLAGEKRAREFLDPDGTVVMAAIKSLTYDSTLLLENGADFVNCWTENEDSFQFQYQDGKALAIFTPLQERITYEQLVSIFMKFLHKDDSWKSDIEFELAPEQPDLAAILNFAENKSAVSSSQIDTPISWTAPPAPAPASAAIVATNVASMAAELDSLNSQESQTLVRPYTPSSSVVWTRGRVSEKFLCPHCGTRGAVHTKKESRKVGVSGGKATGALLTAGLSLFVTGLSRQEKITAAYCGNCEAEWSF